MAMIIDAIARHGVREAIRSLLSPQNTTSDHTENSIPRYACARKKYGSGRKGRIRVYRISNERTKKDGRKVRLYTNVEGVDIDEDERQSFTGIKHTRNYKRSHSIRQKEDRNPPTPDKGRKSKVEFKKLVVKPYEPSDEGSDRRSKSDDAAPSQAKDLSFSSNKESVEPQPVNSRKHLRRKSRSIPHRRLRVVERRSSSQGANRRQKFNRLGDQSSRVERRVQKELGNHYSGALPIPQHQLDRLSLGSALTESSRKLRETAVDSTIKLVNDVGKDTSGVVEHDRDGGEQNASVVLGAPGSPFMQPGLTPQESSDLVFGTGSKMEMRRKLQAGRMDDRIAPDVHEFASQLVRDDPLGEADQEAEACSPPRKSYALGLERSPSGVSEAEYPLE